MRSLLLTITLLVSLSLWAQPGDTTVVGKKRNGLKKGAWKYYDDEHHLLKIERYRKGILRKTYIYNRQGNVIQRINRKGHITNLRGCGC